MGTGSTVILTLFVIIILIVIFNLRIVPQAHTYITEFLGKYRRTWTAGLHILIPFVERVAAKISLKEQVLDFPPQPVITKDNVSMEIDAVIFAKVFDPKLYTYGVEDPVKGLQNLSATTLRNIIGEMELDQTLTSGPAPARAPGADGVSRPLRGGRGGGRRHRVPGVDGRRSGAAGYIMVRFMRSSMTMMRGWLMPIKIGRAHV